jgi:hypothetical protein
MSEIGEIIAFGGNNIEWECPFSHDPEKEKDYHNEFIGVGTKLRKNMAKGVSSINNPQYDQDELKKELDPREQKDNPLNEQNAPSPVKLIINGKLTKWSVVCAAHHCIPAQEALKPSDLLPWLTKNEETCKIKPGKNVKPKVGKVKYNVGYNVNGAQNGVWLPGPYAMKGVWRTLSAYPATLSEQPDTENEDPNVPDIHSSHYAAPLESTQFDYAVQAMNLASAQFHDRHKDYSDVVLRSLNQIAKRLQLFSDINAGKCCDKCAQRIKNDKSIPPPYSIVVRLNQSSKRLRHYLEGTPFVWNKMLFTSERSLKYMEHPKYMTIEEMQMAEGKI